MRIRTTKPEFWASEDIAALDWETRLLFIGLWSYVDDNGVGVDHPKLILASLFPLDEDPRDSLAKVSRGLQTLSDRGLVERYEVDGKRFLHVKTWNRHQKIDRPGRSRYPLPTCDNATRPPEGNSDSRDHRETVAPVVSSKEEGVSKKSKASSDAAGAAPDLEPVAESDPELDVLVDRAAAFEQFWTIYPRKDGKKPARPAFDTALKRSSLIRILEGARRYRDDPNRVSKYTKLPKTWLNADAWEDGPLPPRAERADLYEQWDTIAAQHRSPA